MNFEAFLSQCILDPKYLNVRYTYSHEQYPQYGIGLRFSVDGSTLVTERLFLLAQNGKQRVTETTDINVLYNVQDIPVDILELGCLVSRRVELWMKDKTLDMSILHIKQTHVSTKEWTYDAPN